VHGSIYLADTKLPAKGTIISLLSVTGQSGPKIDQETGEYVIRDQPQAGAFHATADASGSFEITGVPTGDYYVLTRCPGYLSQREYIYPGALSPELNPGQHLPAFVHKVHIASGTTERVDLLLDRGGAIEGTVSFPDGQTRQESLAGIAVEVEIKTRDGRLLRALRGVADTDATGHFRIDEVPPASYVVYAALPTGVVKTAKGLISSGGEIIFCCNSVRGSEARVIEVAGTEVHDRVDIEVATAGLHEVAGRVLTSSGQTVNDGIVRLYPTGERGLSRATALRADGTFSFDLVPDEDYTVSFESQVQADLVGPTADKTGLIMRLRKPPYLPVQQDVHVAGQNPSAITLMVEPAPN